jgi:hypothetical protein
MFDQPVTDWLKIKQRTIIEKQFLRIRPDEAESCLAGRVRKYPVPPPVTYINEALCFLSLPELFSLIGVIASLIVP